MAFVDSAASGSKPSPFNPQAAGGGVSDIFSGFGDLEKMKSDELESRTVARRVYGVARY
jgi:hypothetical protein